MDIILCVIKALSCTLSKNCCISVCTFYLCLVFLLLGVGFATTIGSVAIVYLFLLSQAILQSGKRCSRRTWKRMFRLLRRGRTSLPQTMVIPVQDPESLTTSHVIILSCGEPKISLGFRSDKHWFSLNQQNDFFFLYLVSVLCAINLFPVSFPDHPRDSLALASYLLGKKSFIFS